MLNLLIILLASSVSAILYRAGGESRDPTAKPTWIPMWLRFSQARDAFCPLVLLGLVLVLFGLHTKYWYCYIIFYGASWGFLSTYWDFTGNDNFYLHGLGCSLATIPLLWCGVPWWAILIHGIICTAGMGLWSAWIGTDWIEEEGRGALYIL